MSKVEGAQSRILNPVNDEAFSRKWLSVKSRDLFSQKIPS